MNAFAVTYKWNKSELYRLLKSEACNDWVYSEAAKIAARVNAEAPRYAYTPPQTPPYKASSHRGKYMCVGRVRPSTAQGKAIEIQHGLLSGYGEAKKGKRRR